MLTKLLCPTLIDMESDIPENDRDALFVAQLTAHQQCLLVYVRGLMPGDPNADEVLQRTNAKIWEKRDDFQVGSNFRAWSMAVARFEVLGFRKQLIRDGKVILSDDLEQTIADELEKVQDNSADRRGALKACLEELNTHSRDMLLARYTSSSSLGELAEHFGRSAGGFRVTLSRLRSKLMECVEAKLQSNGSL